VPGDLLDLILIVLIAAFAVSGYRQGFIVGLVSFAGFIGGGAIGAAFAPRVARAIAGTQAWQAVVAIVLVFLAAMAGQLLASGLGVALRSLLTWRPAALLDAVGGAVLSVISVLLIAWLIGSAVAYAPFAVVARQVNGSVVLRGVDRLMPSAASTMFADFRNLLESGPYPQVFGALGAESALGVQPPDPAVVTRHLIAKARRSVVKIEGVAPSCSRRIEGSGFVYAPQHVLTNAHVVAGVTRGPVVITSRGRELASRVVLYDPQRDIAVLDVPGLRARALAFGGPAASGTSAAVAGYPLSASLSVLPARVGATEDAVSPNIYHSAQVTRQIYAIRALVRPGNSGGPLLSGGGRVYGVVFAAALSVPDTGYALTAAEVTGDARAAEAMTAPASTGACD
jgi:S1-C subfamily serine protease